MPFDDMGLLGTEVADAKALSVPLDQAEILVTNKEMEGRALKEFRHEEFAGQLQVVRMERGGVPYPVGPETELKRFDILFVAGLKSAVDKVAATLGRVARPSTGTDLLTLSVGMILGLLIGGLNLKVAGFSVGLGNAGGLLLSGIIVSSAVSRLRFFGSPPNAAPNILEDLGLVTFVGIGGMNPNICHFLRFFPYTLYREPCTCPLSPYNFLLSQESFISPTLELSPAAPLHPGQYPPPL